MDGVLYGQVGYGNCLVEVSFFPDEVSDLTTFRHEDGSEHIYANIHQRGGVPFRQVEITEATAEAIRSNHPKGG